MPLVRPNRIAVLLNDSFADWETGFLCAAARDFFAAEVLHFSPTGGAVESEGGLRVEPAGGFDDVDVEHFSALIVCGSGRWTSPDAADISVKLWQADIADTVIGVICAGTLTAARAGLFDKRRHTSNGPYWLREHAPQYRGMELYQDVNSAIVDNGVVSAPGSAPAAFASAVIGLLYPDHAALAQTRAMLAKSR